VKGGRSGFSLLEVLVAVTIIGFGFAVVFAGMSGSLRGLDRVGDVERHVAQARLILAELDLVKQVRAGDSASGTFSDGTKWTLESSPFITPINEGPRTNPGSVVRINLTLDWPGRNGPQKQVIETYRYTTASAIAIPPLEEQLRELQ
jgi:prepilin-type N-terminal cleavage/methylation domain-containing protein